MIYSLSAIPKKLGTNTSTWQFINWIKHSKPDTSLESKQTSEGSSFSTNTGILTAYTYIIDKSLQMAWPPMGLTVSNSPCAIHVHHTATGGWAQKSGKWTPRPSFMLITDPEVTLPSTDDHCYWGTKQAQWFSPAIQHKIQFEWNKWRNK